MEEQHPSSAPDSAEATSGKKATEDKDNEEKRISSDLAGQTFAYYFRLFRWPVLGVLIAEIVLIILDQGMVYLWFINLLLFVGLTLWIKKVYEGNFIQSLVLNGLAGLTLGFLIALFKLVWHHKVYLFFNIITETVKSLLFRLIISAATYIVITKEYKDHSLLPFKFKNKDKKDKTS